MGFLKKIKDFFLGGGGASGDRGLYFYVRNQATGEVVRVRIDPNNDLTVTEYSQGGQAQGYYIRKVLVGQRSYQRMEAEFYFDGSRNLQDKNVSFGEFVTKEDYEAYQRKLQQEREETSEA
jgi:hypothetical protein